MDVDLDTRISFFEPVYGDDRTGQQQVEHAKRFDAWAKVESYESRDLMRYRQPGAKASVRLTIYQKRDKSKIKDDWQVKLDGDSYMIESIAHIGREWTVLNVYRLEA